MKSARSYRIILPLLAAALAAVLAVPGVALMQAWREHQAFAERQQAAEEELRQVQRGNGQRQAYLAALLNDPAMMERAARERLGYSREDELIFKFGE